MNGTALFSATWHGRAATIGLATRAELGSITSPERPGSVQDVMRPSMLIAVREDGCRDVEIHALGWRMSLLTTWITSTLVSIDTARTVIRTSSGRVYGLEDLQDSECIPTLLGHLDYALRRWGFDDVAALW